MKTMLKQLVLLGVILMASMQSVYAISVSSQPINPPIDFVGLPFLIHGNESVSYLITSTVTTANVHYSTISFEYSSDYQNWRTEFTTAPQATAHWSVTGLLPPKQIKTYYRFRVLGSSGASAVITISDVDDEVSYMKNNKKVDTFVLNDESLDIHASLHADRYTYQVDPSSTIIHLTSHTQLQWGNDPPVDKLYSGPIAKIKNRYNIIVSTAGFGATGQSTFTLTALPTISTQTAHDGDVLTFECHTSSITFSDEVTLPGSALKLGGATRFCGNNDIIEFIFYKGFWRERFFTNNME